MEISIYKCLFFHNQIYKTTNMMSTPKEVGAMCKHTKRMRKGRVWSTFAISANCFVAICDKSKLHCLQPLHASTTRIPFDQPPQRNVAHSSCNPKQEVASYSNQWIFQNPNVASSLHAGWDKAMIKLLILVSSNIKFLSHKSSDTIIQVQIPDIF